MKPLQTFCLEHLKRNVKIIRILEEMSEIIDRFDSYLAYLIITKCIDGRVHGFQSKGIPIGSKKLLPGRTDGNRVKTIPSNLSFWDRVGTGVSRAKDNTPGIPAVFMALAHFSKLDRGCAAHNGDDHAALEAVGLQSASVGQRFGKDLFALHGMTNTDDMAHKFYFPNGTFIAIDKILDEMKIFQSKEIFSNGFLRNPIPDSTLRRYLGHGPVEGLFEKNGASLYEDLQKTIALEALTIEKIDEALNTGKNTILNPKLFKAILKKIEAVKNFPKNLKTTFVYIIAWNIGYSLYKQHLLRGMTIKEREAYLGHSEKLICYGEGFQTLRRNDALLVKPGRVDDTEPLSVAKKVRSSVRKKYPQTFPEVVHINIELPHDPAPEDVADIKGKLSARAELVKSVFSDEEVVILATYSKSNEKMFYPLDIGFNGNAVDIGFDVGKGITRISSPRSLAANEVHYFEEMKKRV